MEKIFQGQVDYFVSENRLLLKAAGEEQELFRSYTAEGFCVEVLGRLGEG